MAKGNWRGDDGLLFQMIASVACLRPDGGAQAFPQFKLFQRVGNFSLEAMKIARGLRKLDTD